MDWVSIVEFSELREVKVSDERIAILENLNDFRDSKVIETIFIYWIEDQSISFGKKKVNKCMIGGSMIFKKTFYRGGVFNSFGTLEFTFKRQEFMKSFLICAYAQGKTMKRGKYFVFADKNDGRKERRMKKTVLREIMENIGMPLDADSLSFMYDGTDPDYWKELKNYGESGRSRIEEKYLELLGIPDADNFNKIKERYRFLVKKNHPDAYPENEREYYMRKMQEINEAYEYLSSKYESKHQD